MANLNLMKKTESDNARWLPRFVRPRRVIIKYTDPFDGTWVGTIDYAYDPRLSADGFYSRGVKIKPDG